MEFFLLAIGAMLGFMFGYLMGFCKADNIHHNIIHDRWAGGYTPNSSESKPVNPPRRPTPPGKE
ncbi:hypothetical protein PSYG_00045 [Psychrobacter phage pOW20-A]|uniref:hypothetical protein n=1 Tax=Psychrobacter phage pOW20-A TaxID=754048 RepID=UPI0002C18C3F|nr:hypothetical protein PSYG_00045 [Psychrobacter phage pOW20-A]AGH57506.1 hypothetical protein PSYG_00045 [Psychrobacter phage pOW20-A]